MVETRKLQTVGNFEKKIYKPIPLRKKIKKGNIQLVVFERKKCMTSYTRMLKLFLKFNIPDNGKRIKVGKIIDQQKQ